MAAAEQPELDLTLSTYRVRFELIVSATGTRDAARVAVDLARSGAAMKASVRPVTSAVVPQGEESSYTLPRSR